MHLEAFASELFIYCIYITIQKFEVGKFFFFMFLKLYLFDQLYNKNSNIVKYFCI